MKKIKLTQGYYALVDDEDYERVNKYNWCFNRKYAVSRLGKYKHKIVYMHKFILNMEYDEQQLDHINENKLDNRKSNLRLASKAENRRNVKMLRNNTSGFKGVCFSKRNNRYYARIWYNNKPIYLGCFKTAKEAAKVYNKAAKKFHKEFAALNKVD